MPAETQKKRGDPGYVSRLARGDKDWGVRSLLLRVWVGEVGVCPGGGFGAR